MKDLMQHIDIRCGDVRKELRKLPAQSVHTVVTSPPYWQLRDYGFEGQLGLERTPQEFIRELVKVFRQVRRVLRDDGTLWVNMGDSYAGNGAAYGDQKSTLQGRKQAGVMGATRRTKAGPKLKRKDRVGIPHMLVFALRNDGWYWRDELVWNKTNAMPSSATDRCTPAHEVLFMLSKRATYYYDQDAIKEDAVTHPLAPNNQWHSKDHHVPGQKPMKRKGRSGNVERVYGVNVTSPALGQNVPWEGALRNKRSVWNIATEAYEGAHFAVMPSGLAVPCVLAGCPPGGVVLDPFAGSGTVGAAAVAHGRRSILIEGNPSFIDLIPHRVEQVVRRLREAPAPPPVAPEQMKLELM